VTLRPFAVSRTEITNAQYANFVTATGYAPARPERFLAPGPTADRGRERRMSRCGT